jgi:hypothetical protein
LYNSKIKVLIDAADHSVHAKITQCEILLGSVEKSIEVLLLCKYLNPFLSIKIEKTHSG